MTTALKMVYWLTQEGMPLSKYGSMLRFMSSEMLKFVFSQGALPPSLAPTPGHCPWTPMGASVAPIHPDLFMAPGNLG